MSWPTIQAAAIAVAQGATNFSSNNVAYESYLPLNKGYARVAVLRYGGFDSDYLTFGPERSVRWRARLELYSKLTSGATSQDTDRQALLDAFAKYPALNGCAGVLDVLIESGQPEPEPVQFGSARYNIEVLTLIIWEVASDVALE